MPPKKAQADNNSNDSITALAAIDAAIPVIAPVTVADIASSRVHEFVSNANDELLLNSKTKRPRFRSDELTTYTNIVNKLNAELGLSKEAALELIGDKIMGKTPSRMTLWRHMHPKPKEHENKVDRRVANPEFDLAVQAKVGPSADGGIVPVGNDMVSYDLVRKAAEEVQATDPRYVTVCITLFSFITIMFIYTIDSRMMNEFKR